MEHNQSDFYERFHKICSILKLISKIDVRLIDNHSSAKQLLVTNRLPEVLRFFESDEQNIHEVLSRNSKNSYFYFINPCELETIAAGLWEGDTYRGFISIGPFISSVPTDEFVSRIISQCGFPIGERMGIQAFYNTLLFLSSNDVAGLGELLVSLIKNPEVEGELITTEISSAVKMKEASLEDLTLEKEIVEKRYKGEKALFQAVSRGDKDLVKAFFKTSKHTMRIPDRIPENPMRSSKNILFVTNTICRLAAEKGGVHPIYLHNISEKYAILIERTNSLPQLSALNQTLIFEYCDLVQNYSYQNYTGLVKQVMTHVQMHLSEELSVQSISDELGVNSSYLSRVFKKEVQQSLIEYINSRRIEEAKRYLDHGGIAITEVALMVGFADLNYFGRVFKKHTGLSPSQYMKGFRS